MMLVHAHGVESELVGRRELVEVLAVDAMAGDGVVARIRQHDPRAPMAALEVFGDVRPGLEGVELRRFRDDRGRVLLDVPRAAIPDGETPAPVRFLPKWDSSILAYAPPERTRILPERFRTTVIGKNGDVAPTVLVDGFVAATWDVGTKRGLTVMPLRRLTKRERAEVDAEGERLVEFFRS